MNNFLNGLVAVANDIKFSLISALQNWLLIGFLSGVVISVLVTGFLLTENPRQIPIILRYSASKSFEKISARQRNESGTYKKSFNLFIRTYARIKLLFLLAFIAFCVMLITVMVTQAQ